MSRILSIITIVIAVKTDHVNKDRLIIGNFCSIACGTKFMFTSGNHTMQSLSNYTLPIFFDEWELNPKDICEAWENKGDTVIGNEVWMGWQLK